MQFILIIVLTSGVMQTEVRSKEDCNEGIEKARVLSSFKEATCIRKFTALGR